MNQQVQQANAQAKTQQLLAKCWADEGFKQKLLTDTMATLKAEVVETPAGLTVKAFENTDHVFHLVIPAKPTDLSDEDLEKVAGGMSSAEKFVIGSGVVIGAMIVLPILALGGVGAAMLER